MASSAIAAILLASVLNMDRQAFGQFMVGRPITMGLIMGLFLDQPAAGIWLGVSVELLWLVTMPLGGNIPPNASLSVSALFIAWALSPFTGETYQDGSKGLLTCFLLSPIWAAAFTKIEKWNRDLADKRYDVALKRLEAGRDPHFFRRNIKGLFLTLGMTIAGLALAVAVNAVFFHFLSLVCPPSWFLALDPLLTFIPFVGLLALAVGMEQKYFQSYLLAFVAALLAVSAI